MDGLIHVGAWTGEEYRDHPGPLLLFEPQAEAFAVLRENCPGATLVNKAVGSTSGKQTMNTASPSHSSSLLACSGSVFGGTETVDVVTLDSAMRGRSGYDTLRIDTQGYELEVLKGAKRTLKRLKRVELEVHDPNTYAGAATLSELDEFMAAQGWARSSNDPAEVVYEKEQP